MQTNNNLTEDEWFDELHALSISKGLGGNEKREGWRRHWLEGRTPEQAMRQVMGDEAFDRLCSHGVFCQGRCEHPGHEH